MFKGRHFDKFVILLCVRWYLAYNCMLCNLKEMMAERAVAKDHSAVRRWVLHFSPKLLERFHRRKRQVTRKWNLDETYSAPRPLFRWDAYDWNAREKGGFEEVPCLLL